MESVDLLGALQCNVLLISDGTTMAGGLQHAVMNSFIVTGKLHLVSFQEKSAKTTKIYAVNQSPVFPEGSLPKC